MCNYAEVKADIHVGILKFQAEQYSLQCHLLGLQRSTQTTDIYRSRHSVNVCSNIDVRAISKFWLTLVTFLGRANPNSWSTTSSCRWLLTSLPGNQTHQDTLDWIKLGGVDERIGRDVEKCHEEYHVPLSSEHCEARIKVHK